METRLEIDGRDTGIRNRIEWGNFFQNIFQAIVIAAIIGGWGFFTSINNTLRDTREDTKNELLEVKSQVAMANYRLEQMEKSQAGFVTKAEVEASRRVRDAQIQSIEARITKLETVERRP